MLSLLSSLHASGFSTTWHFLCFTHSLVEWLVWLKLLWCVICFLLSFSSLIDALFFCFLHKSDCVVLLMMGTCPGPEAAKQPKSWCCHQDAIRLLHYSAVFGLFCDSPVYCMSWPVLIVARLLGRLKRCYWMFQRSCLTKPLIIWLPGLWLIALLSIYSF